MYYDSAQTVLVKELGALLTIGKDITVRGFTTKELLFRNFTVLNPLHRVIAVKHRNANIFAQIAETLWMLAGRNDLEFLEPYIPSVYKWSDDQKTWRGAYGPRLRAWPAPSLSNIPTWYEIDQLREVANKINTDRYTRQAIIMIWDPAKDWVEGSKDYPCNNWLHFIVRDGKLHLNVAVRSNDVMFGFSHADFFGWSVLLQMMAYWTAKEVGTIVWNVTSWHVYERHWDKAMRIANTPNKDTVYSYEFEPPEFSTPFSLMPSQLSDFFSSESMARHGDIVDAIRIAGGIKDDFIRTCAKLLIAYHMQRIHGTDGAGELAKYLQLIPPCDMKVAAIEYLSRSEPSLPGRLIMTGNETEFFTDYLRDASIA
jgi:thymidylate synthase